MTWLLVSTSPEAVRTMPVPAASALSKPSRVSMSTTAGLILAAMDEMSVEERPLSLGTGVVAVLPPKGDAPAPGRVEELGLTNDGDDESCDCTRPATRNAITATSTMPAIVRRPLRAGRAAGGPAGGSHGGGGGGGGFVHPSPCSLGI